MHARRLRQPRVVLVLAVAVVSFGVFSSSVGIGALPTSTLPVYGVTNGDGSRTTVAELGDVNGDGIGDYAVGPADANGRLGHRLRVPRARGCALAGADRARPRRRLVHDHRPRRRAARLRPHRRRLQRRRPDDIAIGAPRPAHRTRPAAAPCTWSSARAPAEPRLDAALPHRLHERPGGPAPHSPLWQPLRRLQRQLAHGHVAGGAARRQRRRLRGARGRLARREPPPARRGRRGGALRQALGRAHQPRRPVGERVSRTTSTSTSRRSTTSTSARHRERRRHDGRRLARPRDRSAAGRQQRPGRLRLGLDHQRPPPAHRRRLQHAHGRQQLSVAPARRT